MTELDVRKVIGSSPISSTKKKDHPIGWSFLFALDDGLEPITNATVRWPVAAASSKTGGYNNFCPMGKNAYRVLYRPLHIKNPNLTSSDFCIYQGLAILFPDPSIRNIVVSLWDVVSHMTFSYRLATTYCLNSDVYRLLGIPLGTEKHPIY